MSKRIASAEWIRIFAAFCVVILHFEAFIYPDTIRFGYMYIVVEFFFMFSGFLLMRVICKEPLATEISASGQLLDSLWYIFCKAKGFYSGYIIAFIMVFVLTMITNNVTDLGDILSQLFHFKWEILLMQTAGFTPHPAFNADYLVGSAWYLAAMLLAMIPVYYLAKYHRRVYTNVIAPLSAVFIYVFIMQAYGTMDVGNEVVVFTLSANLRAFAGLSMGCLCYVVYEKASAAKWRKKVQITASALEILLVFSLIVPILWKDSFVPYDMLFWVPIFAALLFLCFSNQTLVARFLNTHFTRPANYLGRLSLYIYLFHWFFVQLFKNFFPELPYWVGMISYCTSVFVFSALMMWVLGVVKKQHKYIDCRRSQ